MSQERKNQDTSQGIGSEINHSDLSNDVGTKYYRLGVNKEHIPAIEFHQITGEFFNLPYSHQPSIHYKPDEGLFIHTINHVIRIKGHGNFSKLANKIAAQKVIWIKESETPTKDDGSEDLFISEIAIFRND